MLVRNQIADLIKRNVAETAALPAVEVVYHRLRTRQYLTQPVTIAQRLEEFRTGKIEESAQRSLKGHIRATLRHALNMAIRQDRLIGFNPAGRAGDADQLHQ
ncbi:hypothetical protein [Nonomuraea sp. NPDC050310]|uniref:hypothetical protein n=1 Tax=Nonomuraea sp. NPDC050310 TaxID=3154935 RepID=UPI003409D81A